MINLDTQSYDNIIIINMASIRRFTLACFMNLIDSLAIIKYLYRPFKIFLHYFFLKLLFCQLKFEFYNGIFRSIHAAQDSLLIFILHLPFVESC